MLSEVEHVRLRYARRKQRNTDGALQPWQYMAWQERERTLVRWINFAGLAPVQEKTVLEVGCGSGGNLLQFMKFGFRPANLMGIELLEERAENARRMLPASIQVLCGDASEMALGREHFDVLVQMTMFSSLLDPVFQKKMAQQMWRWVKPGGGILWYDFIYNNPKNPDVMGVPIRRIRELFPEATLKTWRITLAPPINRFVTRIHPSLYTLCNCFPFLRTHVMCWIQK